MSSKICPSAAWLRIPNIVGRRATPRMVLTSAFGNSIQRRLQVIVIATHLASLSNLKPYKAAHAINMKSLKASVLLWLSRSMKRRQAMAGRTRVAASKTAVLLTTRLPNQAPSTILTSWTLRLGSSLKVRVNQCSHSQTSSSSFQCCAWLEQSFRSHLSFTNRSRVPSSLRPMELIMEKLKCRTSENPPVTTTDMSNWSMINEHQQAAQVERDHQF